MKSLCRLLGHKLFFGGMGGNCIVLDEGGEVSEFQVYECSRKGCEYFEHRPNPTYKLVNRGTKDK